jgi:hypothetical protein
VEGWRGGRDRTESDNFGLARQLGAAPPAGSVGEKIGIGIGVQRLTARWMRNKNPA